jgi:hypothetical protein
MDLNEIGMESVDWIVYDTSQWCVLVNTEINLWVPYKAENFVTIRLNSSRRIPLQGLR